MSVETDRASSDLAMLTDASFFAENDPHALWRRLRAERPIAWTTEPNGPGFWSITGYAEGLQVQRDWKNFTTSEGSMLVPGRAGPDPGAGQMLALSDPPRHTEIRRALAPLFAHNRMVALEARARNEARELIQYASELRSFDFVEIASRLPANILFDILGIPKTDRDVLYKAVLSTTAMDLEKQQTAHTELLLSFFDRVAGRRHRPHAHEVGVDIALEQSGCRFTDDEIVLSCVNVLAAGFDSVRLASAGGFHALVGHREQWIQLRENPRLIDPAAEEIIRWTCPPLHVLRTAKADIVLGKQPIKRGDRVVTWLPSLNRDESVFVEPDTFLLSRHPNRHVGFGAGVHQCLGATLARLELRILLQEAGAAWRSLGLAGHPRRLHSIILQGIEYLPLTIDAA